MKNLIACLSVCVLSGAAIADTGTTDKDGDGVDDSIDNCYLYNPDQADCNENGIGDVCDIADGTSYNCDAKQGNTVPDECQPDCDGDGYIDPCDNEGDCNEDGIPDNCETDCNENNYPDVCDIMYGISQDINNDGIPDECQDCDEDGIPDNYETDCNYNDIPDDCDIIEGNSEDVNEDGIPDECQDCNNNGVLDPEDIANGTSEDVDGNGIPDECTVTWLVDDDAPADFDNIQAAIDAIGGPSLIEIIVMPGTYTSSQAGHVVNMLGKAVTLRSMDPSDPEVVAATIIDGESNRRGIACASGESYETIIDGFTIMNGQSVNFDYNNNNDDDSWENDGGGMINIGSSPTITNCTFIDNDSSSDGGGMNNFMSNPNLTDCTFTNNTASNWSGGGMNNKESSSPIITNCSFTNNMAGNGGGMSCRKNSNPTINGCRFMNNTTSNNYYVGGGLISLDDSNPLISDTYFCNNVPEQIFGVWTDTGGTCISFQCDDNDGDGWPDECGTVGDGVHYVPEEYATITEAIFAAGDHDEIIVGPGTYSVCGTIYPDSFVESIINTGGKRLWVHSSDGPEATIIQGSCSGTWLSGGETPSTVIEGFTFDGPSYYPAQLFVSSPTFKNCVFTGGSRDLYCRGGSPELFNCTFSNNAGSDGAMVCGEYEGSPKLTDCTFTNNSGAGAGIYSLGMNLELTNCLFENNSGQGGSFGGGILHVDRANLVLNNCIFENNSSGGYALTLIVASGGSFSCSINDCEIKNNTGGGMIYGGLVDDTCTINNSKFVNNTNGGIQNALPSETMTLTDSTVCDNGEYQIAGHWIDGGGNSIADVCFDDCHAADITGDGTVGVNDLLAILGYWGTSIPAGDVNGDGIVDVVDLLIVIGNWGPCE